MKGLVFVFALDHICKPQAKGKHGVGARDEYLFVFVCTPHRTSPCRIVLFTHMYGTSTYVGNVHCT